MMKLKSVIFFLLASILITQPVFSEHQEKTLEQLATIPSENGPLTKQQQMEDRRILGVIMAIDQNEMGMAHVVVNKKTSQKVRRYAKYLYKQHEANLKMLNKLSKSTGLDALQSPTSTLLIKNCQKEMASLGTLQKEALETAYTDAMVQGHKAALHLIDTDLYKNVSGYKTKEFVKKTRDMIYRHLVRAMTIQKELK